MVLLLFNVLVIDSSIADTTLEFGVYNPSNERTRVDSIKIRSGVVRLPEVNGSYMLYNQNDQQLFQVNSSEYSYVPVKPGSIEDVQQKTREIIDQVQEALDRMPLEQRAQIEKALDQLATNPLENAFPAPRVKVVQTGRTQQINGNRCVITETFVDEVKRFEICLSQSSDLGISVADTKAYNDYMNYMVNFSRALAPSAAPGSEAMTNRGIPLSTKQFLADGTVVETLLENVSTQALDPRLFVIPKNFKNRSLVP